MSKITKIKYPCAEKDCDYAIILPAEHGMTELTARLKAHWEETHESHPDQ